MSLLRRHVVKHTDANGRRWENTFDGSGCALMAKKRVDELTRAGLKATVSVEEFRGGQWQVVLSTNIVV